MCAKWTQLEPRPDGEEEEVHQHFPHRHSRWWSYPVGHQQSHWKWRRSPQHSQSTVHQFATTTSLIRRKERGHYQHTHTHIVSGRHFNLNSLPPQPRIQKQQKKERRGGPPIAVIAWRIAGDKGNRKKKKQLSPLFSPQTES